MYVRVRKFLPSARRECKAGNFLGLFTAENTEDGEKLSSADSLGPDLHRFSSIRKEEIATSFLHSCFPNSIFPARLLKCPLSPAGQHQLRRLAHNIRYIRAIRG